MYGLEEIRRMNSNYVNRVMEVPMSEHVNMEHHECIRAAIDNFNNGLYSYEQYIEELAEIRATYE